MTERAYLDLLKEVLENGVKREDRTGTGTLSKFGAQIRFNLQDGFPAVTTKKLAWRSVVAELLWFLEGSTDERRLAELTHGKDRSDLVGRNTIWTANADKQGKDLGYVNNDLYKGLGPVYGAQWRNFNGESTHRGIDQIRTLLQEIRTNPESRRLILSAWNVSQLHEMALPPCHILAQFYIHDDHLSCQLYQRSADLLLGIPFNIASYALLTHIIARDCGLEVGDFVHTMGDAHIYLNHKDQVIEQLARTPYDFPQLKISTDFSLNEVLDGKQSLENLDKFTLENYEHHSFIKAPMAV